MLLAASLGQFCCYSSELWTLTKAVWRWHVVVTQQLTLVSECCLYSITPPQAWINYIHMINAGHYIFYAQYLLSAGIYIWKWSSPIWLFLKGIRLQSMNALWDVRSSSVGASFLGEKVVQELCVGFFRCFKMVRKLLTQADQALLRHVKISWTFRKKLSFAAMLKNRSKISRMWESRSFHV